MAGAITNEDRVFVEEWENLAASSHSIIRFDIRGDFRHEVISGRRNFQVTTAERKVMQDRVLLKTDGPFQNGSFRPIIVPDSVSVETNPNALSDDQIKSILVSSDLAWEGWVEIIDAPDTLTRMMDLSDSVDGVTLARTSSSLASFQRFVRRRRFR